MRPWLHSSHWSPISLVPQCDPDYTVLIGPLISLVPQCNPDYTVLIGPPSHWSPNVILVIQFSLVPHLIGPPMVGLIHTPNIGPIHEDFGTLWVISWNRQSIYIYSLSSVSSLSFLSSLISLCMYVCIYVYTYTRVYVYANVYIYIVCVYAYYCWKKSKLKSFVQQ